MPLSWLVQERNLNEGVAGHQIELVALNDFNESETAATQAKALVADPAVFGVVGHLSSNATIAAISIYEEANLALSIPWTIAVDSLPERSGRVSVAASESETVAELERVSGAQGLSNRLVLTDIQLDQIVSDTQALELAGDAVTAAEIMVLLAQEGVALPLLGHVEVGSPVMMQIAATAANGLIFVSPGPNPADVPLTEDFIATYQGLAGFPPGPRAVLAYDATQVLLDAIEQTIQETGRQPTRSGVQGRIGAVRRQGLSGEIAFDERGRRVDAPIWLYEIVEGQYPGKLLTYEN